MRVHRLGIIGCGWFVGFHLQAVARLTDRVEVVWVTDMDADKAEQVAQQAGARAIGHYREGLGEVDAVLVLLPHHLHHPVSLDCLQAGVHVLLEKPMALTVTECDAMIEAAERGQRVLMVAYPHRYRRSMQRFKQLITGGEYGPLVMLDGHMDESLQGYAMGWLAKRETLGGGVFFSSSPHMLDVMLWIAGPARHAAMVGARGGIPMEGEDTAASVIKFESGIIGVTRHTWASPAPGTWYTMRAQCRDAYLTLTTTPLGDLFTEGSRCPWRTRIEATTPEGGQALWDNDEGLDLEPELAHFFDCVETGDRPATDGKTARAIVELVQSAYADADAHGANVGRGE